jgi:hypothetical protein
MRFIRIKVSLVIVFLLTGCYLKHIDLVEEHGVTLDIQREGNVSISSVSAYQEGEHLLVSGSIGQKKATSAFSGWVQITVLLDNGTVFEESCYRVWRKTPPGPRWHVSSKNGLSSFFDITLSKVPPPGSVIRVTGSAQDSLCT